jgi:hypothetical protein
MVAIVTPPIERREVRGRRQSIAKFRSTDASPHSVNPVRSPHARARRAPIPASSDADRPAPAGSAALRLLADVDISF